MKWVEIHMIVDCMGGRGFMREKCGSREIVVMVMVDGTYRSEYLPYEEVRVSLVP